MATDVAAQTLSLAATAPVPLTADAAGNTFSPAGSGAHYLRVINGSGGSITVTVDDPTTAGPDGATAYNPDVSLVVPAGTSRLTKIANVARFQNPTTGKVALAWSAATSVTFELFT